MKEKKSILGSLFGKDKEAAQATKREEIQVTYEKINPPVKPAENRVLNTPNTNQLNNTGNTSADDEYYQNLIKEATAPKKEVQPTSSVKENPNTTDDKKVGKNAWSNERFKERTYTALPVKPIIKPLLVKKLTILLVEETKEAIPFVKMPFSKSLEMVEDTDYLCIIRYSDKVEATINIRPKDKFLKEELELKEDTENDKKCYYDALKKTYEIISEYSNKVMENNLYHNIRIDKIEVIGMGTSSDNCSETSFEDALKTFDKILQRDIKTRYFSINDISMKNAAALGFRSIGSMEFNF